MTALRATVLDPAAGFALALQSAQADADADFAGSPAWLQATAATFGDASLVHVGLVDAAGAVVGHLALQRTRAGWRSGLPGRATLSWPMAELGYGFRPRWLVAGATRPWLAALRACFPHHRLELCRTAPEALGASPVPSGIDTAPGVATWSLRVPGTRELWLAGLHGKHRRDLAKYRRDIDRGGGTWLDFAVADEAALAACFQLHAARLQQKGTPQARLSATAERFLRALAATTAGAGLRLSLLQHDGRFVAACLSFVHRRRFKAFVSGWDRSHGRWDLGRQVLYHQVLAEFERGLAEIDFLGGDLDYKREFGLVREPTLDVVAAGGALARFCSRVVGGARGAWRRVRQEVR